jgi:DNA primase
MTACWTTIEPDDFTHPHYRAIFEHICELGGPAVATQEVLRERLHDGDLTKLVSAMSVETLHVSGAPDDKVAVAYVVRLRELTAARRIEQIKSKLQRTNPVTEVASYNRMFGELVALESHRRALREQAIGSGIA